jgi:hypothetical protein
VADLVSVQELLHLVRFCISESGGGVMRPGAGREKTVEHANDDMGSITFLDSAPALLPESIICMVFYERVHSIVFY